MIHCLKTVDETFLFRDLTKDTHETNNVIGAIVSLNSNHRK